MERTPNPRPRSKPSSLYRMTLGSALKRTSYEPKQSVWWFYLLPLLDFIVAVSWTFGAPSRTATVAYAPARTAAAYLGVPSPDALRLWGGILLTLTVVALAGSFLHARLRWVCLALLTSYFVFWIVLFGAAYLSQGSSIFGFCGAILFFAVHLRRLGPARAA